jgi:hypothetical protein
MEENVNPDYCQECGHVLGRYNTTNLCYTCELKKQKAEEALELKTLAFKDMTKGEYFKYSDWRFKDKQKTTGRIGTLQDKGTEFITGSVAGTQRIPLPAHTPFSLNTGSIIGIKELNNNVSIARMGLDRQRPFVVLATTGTVHQPYRIQIQRQDLGHLNNLA